MTKDDQYLSSGAYALNALSAEETLAFERAMLDFPELAIESAELAETAALLGMASVPAQPSGDLKASIMSKLAETPQVGPGPRSRHAALPARDAAGSTGDAAERTSAAVVEFPVTAASEEESVDAAFSTPLVASSPFIASSPLAATTPATVKARARWFARPVGALVAAAAAVALFVGGGVVGTALTDNSSSSTQQASANSLAEIYAAADVQSTHSTITGGGDATVVWSSRLGRSAVVATGLPSLPSDKTYEAWYINGTSITPAGTFTPGGENTTWHVLTGNLTAGDTVGVTVEPSGGSQAPTTTPILAVPSA